MEKENLKYVLAQHTERKLPDATQRAMQLPLDSRKVVTLVGIRRSGKAYLLYETMRRLESQGVNRRQIVYLTFEDDRLLPIRPEELDLILRAHEELYPETASTPKYLFFDEIQNARGWEPFIRRLHDTEDVQIFHGLILAPAVTGAGYRATRAQHLLRGVSAVIPRVSPLSRA